MNNNRLRRIEGTVLGFAIGDALGMPVEYKNLQHRVTDFLPNSSKGLAAGQYTDDTQTLLCVLDSILAKGKVNPEDVSKRMIGWFLSGKARSIGHATRASLERLSSGEHYTRSGEPGDRGGGNGALPRVVPYSLFYANTECPPRHELRNIIKMTHNSKETHRIGLFFDYSLRALINEAKPEDVVAGLQEMSHGKLKRKFGKMLDGLNDIYPEQYVRVIGNGGSAVESFLSACYCFLRTPGDFKTTLLTAVNSGGDADSRAAIAGALSGAYNGVSGIPAYWSERVEDSAKLLEKTRKLYDLAVKHAA